MSLLSISLLLMGCSNGWFGKNRDPEPDTGWEDTGDDADADTDADADSDTDTDTDADTDVVDPLDEDNDGDGFSENEGDCDDTTDARSPDNDEDPYNGIDDDCDDSTPDDDLDDDGYNNADDCNDDDPEQAPDLDEDPTDGKDNDCDDVVDERFDVFTIDDNADMGLSSALGVDSMGNVHIAYLDADNYQILYANKPVTGSWTIGTVVDSNYGMGLYLSGDVDNRDQFQISYTYQYSGGYALYFGYRTSSGTWDATYLVDSASESGSYDVGQFVDLAVDPTTGYPNFLYYDGDGAYDLVGSFGYGVPVLRAFDDLTLVTLDAAIQTDIATWGPTGYYTTLAIDSTGTYHGAWFDSGADFGGGELQYGALDLGSIYATSSETIASGDHYHAAIALKSDNTPCVAYQDSDNKDVYYACRSGSGTWASETVETTGAVGQGTQLVFNSADEPYIVYYNETSGALRMAHKDNSTGWATFQVDGASGDVGQYPSLDVDSSDVVHVSYYDVDNGALLYAYGQ
jgi:hypothetical protein